MRGILFSRIRLWLVQAVQAVDLGVAVRAAARLQIVCAALVCSFLRWLVVFLGACALRLEEGGEEVALEVLEEDDLEVEVQEEEEVEEGLEGQEEDSGEDRVEGVVGLEAEEEDLVVVEEDRVEGVAAVVNVYASQPCLFQQSSIMSLCDAFRSHFCTSLLPCSAAILFSPCIVLPPHRHVIVAKEKAGISCMSPFFGDVYCLQSSVRTFSLLRKLAFTT